MKKETFVTILNAVDEYYNGDISKAFSLIGIQENAITDQMDNILIAIDKEVDPKNFARSDEYTLQNGSYIFEWLFSCGEFQEVCKTADDLFDYIVNKYNNEK